MIKKLWANCAHKMKAHKEEPCKEEGGELCECECHKNTDKVISDHFSELGKKSWEVRREKILLGNKKVEDKSK